MAILSVGTLRPGASRALGLLPGTKSTIGDGLFGDIGGQTIATPSLSFADGTISRTNTEFLDISRRALSNLEAQRSRIGGAFSEFTTARLQDVENVRARTVGNLRSQLGRRGILGASFAQDAITRTELDFQNQADKVRAEAQVQEFGLELENLQTQQAAAQSALTQELQLLGVGAQISGNLLNASLQRQRIQADITIAQLQIAAAAAGRRRGSGGVRLGGTTFGPGGPLGSFSRFGSPTGGFRGSTGTTATSVPFTTQFAPNFNISSGINPGGATPGTFSAAFVG